MENREGAIALFFPVRLGHRRIAFVLGGNPARAIHRPPPGLKKDAGLTHVAISVQRLRVAPHVSLGGLSALLHK